MTTSRAKAKRLLEPLAKCPTGIQGLDEITQGGLPRGRPTLVCGSAGSGKTLMAMEFLVRGALEFDEPGLFVCFEEEAAELTSNVASLGFDLEDLAARNKLRIDHVHIERSEIEETGEYDLEGLFIRLADGIDTIGAKRVVLDTIEALFSGLPNHAILRSELRRLFRWLKDKGVTAIITGERGDSSLTRYGLEEYLADCVIMLDDRVADQQSVRRLRIVKYRGSKHGGNEYPFLIDENGFSVVPITSMGLDHEVSSERISSGIPRLDTLLGGDGFYRGSSILISGTAGTGKTSFAAQFADAACGRGEQVLYFAFEESPAQIIRNMRSIGVDLGAWFKKGLLRFQAARPTLYGLEMHLAMLHKAVETDSPRVVILDRVSNFTTMAVGNDIKSMLMRLMDFLKGKQMTALFTSLTHAGSALEETQVGISSLMDTWILIRDLESDGERNRGLHIFKSRGMAHSNQVRECLLTNHGMELVDVYSGSDGAVMGCMRLAREAKERAASLASRQEVERQRRDQDRKRLAFEARIAALHAEFEAEQKEFSVEITREAGRAELLEMSREDMARLRKADAATRDNGDSPTRNDNGGHS